MDFRFCLHSVHFSWDDVMDHVSSHVPSHALSHVMNHTIECLIAKFHTHTVPSVQLVLTLVPSPPFCHHPHHCGCHHFENAPPFLLMSCHYWNSPWWLLWPSSKRIVQHSSSFSPPTLFFPGLELFLLLLVWATVCVRITRHGLCSILQKFILLILLDAVHGDLCVPTGQLIVLTQQNTDG